MKYTAGEPRVSTGATSSRVDGGMDRLLDVEQGMERRVRAAEAEAQGRVEIARAAAQRRDEERRAEVELAARAEEAADLARHTTELARIAREGALRVAALREVPEEEILRRARKALAIVAGIGPGDAVRS